MLTRLRLIVLACLIGASSVRAVVQFEVVHAFKRPPEHPAGLVRGSDGVYWGVSGTGGTAGHGTVFRVKDDGSEFDTLVSFTGYGGGVHRGSYPSAALVEDGAGSLWGSTPQGGPEGYGTIFRVDAVTRAVTTVLDFTGQTGANRGNGCHARMVNDGTGYLWGTTTSGGSVWRGTIFKIHAATGTLTTVVDFGNEIAGSGPAGALCHDGAGHFWGATDSGGAYGAGTVFKVNALSGVLTTVAEFTNSPGPARGRYPSSGLVDDGAGFLWGCTQLAGPANCGTLYKVEKATGAITTVADFTGTTGATPGRYPTGMMVNDGAGSLWGRTSEGGANNFGTLFRVDIATAAVTTPLHLPNSFGSAVGAGMQELIAGGPGELWASFYNGGATQRGTMAKYDITGGSFSVVLTFADYGYADQGMAPSAGLVSDGAGFLWTTTSAGGAGNHGTLLKIDATNGEKTTVAEFTGAAGTLPGSSPQATLVADGTGALWGSTSSGGSANCGTIFKVDVSTGVATTVVSFTGQSGSALGTNPAAALISDGAGYFWGATSSFSSDGGTIFKINIQTGALTTVKQFSPFDPAPGVGPSGALASDGAGFFWGTTAGGGYAGQGTVFKVEAATGNFTKVAEFIGSTAENPGRWPRGGLVSDGAGHFWGTAENGGIGNGTIFKVHAATHRMTTVVQFSGTSGLFPGRSPQAPLVRTAAGELWGTTPTGGSAGGGTIFRINPVNGAFGTEHHAAGNGGTSPARGARLFADSEGHLFGTMQQGGPGAGGTIFRLRVGPIVQTEEATAIGPASATLRGTVDPLGTNTTTWFEWGTVPDALNQSTLPADHSSSGARGTSAPLSGLSFGTTYYYRLRSGSSANALPQFGATRSFSTAPDPDMDDDGLPDAWEIAHWGTTGGHSAEDDWDRDEINELVEYATGLNPKVGDAADLPPITVEAHGFFLSERYLTLRVARRPGIIYSAESTGDLDAGWSSATVVPVLGIVNAASSFQVRDTVPVSAGGRRFLRLRVTADSTVHVEPAPLQLLITPLTTCRKARA